MCNAEVEEGAGVAFNLYAAFVEFLGALNIPFLEFLGTLFKTLHRLDFGRVGGRGVRRGRSSPAFREMDCVSDSSADCNMQHSRLEMFLYGPRGTEMPQRDGTRTVDLAGGHVRTARLDRDLCAVIRSCGAEGVASTRAARTDVVCSILLIVSAQLRVANLATV